MYNETSQPPEPYFGGGRVCRDRIWSPNIWGPSLLGAEFVRGRVCQGPSLLGAERESPPNGVSTQLQSSGLVAHENSTFRNLALAVSGPFMA